MASRLPKFRCRRINPLGILDKKRKQPQDSFQLSSRVTEWQPAARAGSLPCNSLQSDGSRLFTLDSSLSDTTATPAAATAAAVAVTPVGASLKKMMFDKPMRKYLLRIFARKDLLKRKTCKWEFMPSIGRQLKMVIFLILMKTLSCLFEK